VDRITRLRIKNVRAIESLDLEVSSLTVLIGENGAGKSTILECLEILRKASDSSFFQQLYTMHRGMHGLLRKGARSLSLGVVIEDDAHQQPRIEYGFSLVSQGAGAVVEREHLLVIRSAADPPLRALDRNAVGGSMFDQRVGKLVPIPQEAMRPDQLVIGSFGSLPPQKAIERLLAVLRGIEVHLRFDTLATWAARSYQLAASLRGSTLLQPTDRLNLLGFNFANAWAALKNQNSSAWNETLALVRLGLGDGIDTVNVDPDAGGGNIAVSLRRFDMAEPIPAANLSDGQLSWLAFVAMARLNHGRSLLAVDEPELHLHPSLLGRVVSLLTGIDGGAPLILCTHSDRVLELLDDPVSATRVCSLDGGKAVVSRIDGVELPRWLERFGDLGQLRASGYLHRVLVPAESEGPGHAETPR